MDGWIESQPNWLCGCRPRMLRHADLSAHKNGAFNATLITPPPHTDTLAFWALGPQRHAECIPVNNLWNTHVCRCRQSLITLGYICIRDSVIKNHGADFFFFSWCIYSHNCSAFFLKALLMLRYVHSCSFASLALGCQLLPCAEHIIDF